jgi:hypothetical protein
MVANYLGDGPRCFEAKQMLVEFFVSHFLGFLSSGVVPLPIQNPDRPEITAEELEGFYADWVAKSLTRVCQEAASIEE